MALRKFERPKPSPKSFTLTDRGLTFTAAGVEELIKINSSFRDAKFASLYFDDEPSANRIVIVPTTLKDPDRLPLRRHRAGTADVVVKPLFELLGIRPESVQLVDGVIGGESQLGGAAVAVKVLSNDAPLPKRRGRKPKNAQ